MTAVSVRREGVGSPERCGHLALRRLKTCGHFKAPQFENLRPLPGTVSIYSGGTLDLNNRTLANTINAFSGGALLDTGSSTAVHVSGTALFSGTTDGTINIAQSGYGDFLGVVSHANVTGSSGGTATFQNTVIEYGTATSDADVVVQAGGRVRLVDTGGLNLGTTDSPGVFDLLGLTAGSYSLPSTASLAGVGTISGSGGPRRP